MCSSHFFGGAGIIGDFIVQSRIDHVAGRSNKHRVAIRGRQSRSARTDIAAGTANVLDVELVSNLFGQLLCDDTAENIGRSRLTRTER